MAEVLDDEVVQLRLDNSQFESGAKEALSWLDKLKAGFDFKKSEKTFQQFDSSATKDMNNIAKAADMLANHLTATVAKAALLGNVFTDLYGKAKNMFNQLAIEPITTGFQEYELKMDSVQTIMASTGESIDVVNQYLQELNEYSDKTIYSFADMTSNIGKFTNAGVSLDRAVLAIKGVSNEAAVSGANANEASRAMYNFSQALGAGFVKLVDWKSIENANMATMEFKTNLLNTAVAMGTVRKEGDKWVTTTAAANKSQKEAATTAAMFTENLSAQWLTTDVLVKTLGDYADESTEIGKKAYEAATQVKTWTQLWGTLKEAAQSGWAETWELVIGDMKQAKAFYTELGNLISGVIDQVSDSRNSFIRAAAGDSWTDLKTKIEDCGVSAADFENTVTRLAKAKYGEDVVQTMIEAEGSIGAVFKKGRLGIGLIRQALDEMSSGATTVGETVAHTFEEISDVVERTLNGEFGHTEERWAKYTEMGYDAMELQALVNKRVYEGVISADDLTDSLLKMSDAELKANGYTEEQIAGLKKLAEQAKDAKTPIGELLKTMTEKSGRELFHEGLLNILKAIGGVGSSVKAAFSDVFEPIDPKKVKLLIAKFNELTQKMIPTEKRATQIQRAFRGLFSLFKIGTTSIKRVGEAIKNYLSKHLKPLDVDIFEVAASFGDLLTGLKDWVVTGERPISLFDSLADSLKGVKKQLIEFYDKMKRMPVIGSAIEYVVTAFEKIWKFLGETVDKLKDGEGIFNLDGLDGFFNAIVHSFDTFTFSVEGFRNAIANVWKALEQYFGPVIDWVKDKLGKFAKDIQSATDLIHDNLGALIAIGMAVFMLAQANKVTVLIEKLTRGLFGVVEGVTEVVVNAAKLESQAAAAIKRISKSLSGLFRAAKFQLYATAVLTLAISVGVLAGALILLSKVPADRLWSCVGALAVLVLAVDSLVGVVALLSYFTHAGVGAELMSLATSLVLISLALLMVSTIKTDKLLKIVGSMTGAILGILVVCKLLNATGGSFGTAATSLLGISSMFMAFAAGMKILDTCKWDHFWKTIGAFAICVVGLIALCTIMNGLKVSPWTSMAMASMSFSVLILVGAMKLLTTIKIEDVRTALLGFIAVIVLFNVMAGILGKGAANAAKVGLGFLGLSAGLVILVAGIWLLSKMSRSTIDRGVENLTSILAIIGIMVLISKLGGANAAKVGLMMLAIGVAMVPLSIALALIGMIPEENLKKALNAFKTLGAVFSVMIASTGLAKDAKASIVPLMFAVVAMTACIAALTLIKDTNKLNAAVAGLSIVMLAFSVMIVALSTLKQINWKSTVASLGMLSVCVLAIGYALKITAGVPWKTALGASAGISLVMLTMVAALYGLQGVFMLTKPALIGIAVLSAVCVGLAGVLLLMKDIDPKAALAGSAAISLLMGVMTGSLIGLQFVKDVNFAVILKALGAIGMIIGAFGVVAGLLGLIADDVGPYVEKGFGVLNTIVSGIVEFAKTAIVGAVDILGASLTTLGAYLETFGGQVNDFFAGFDAPPDNAVNAMKSLAEVVLLMAAADFISGIATITSFFAGGALTTNQNGGIFDSLNKFGEAMNSFNETISGLSNSDLNRITKCADAAEALARIVDVTPKTGGLWQSIAGESDIEKFSAGLRAFAEAMASFGVTAKVIDDEMAEAITRAVDLARDFDAIVEVAPKTGGLWQAIAGETDIEKFGNGIAAFGESLVGFGTAVLKIDEDMADHIETAADLAGQLDDMVELVPKSGGIWQSIFGEADMQKFGNSLKEFGAGIFSFAKSTSGLKSHHLVGVSYAMSITRTMAEMHTSVTDSLTFFEKLAGVSYLDGVSDDLSKFAEALITFADTLGSLDETAVNNLNTGIRVMDTLSAFAASIPETSDTKLNLADFGLSATTLANSVVDFVRIMNSISSADVDTAKANMNGICDALTTGVPNVDWGKVRLFIDSIKDLATQSVKGFLDAFKNSRSDISEAVSKFITDAKVAVEIEGNTRLSEAMNKIIDEMISTFSKREQDIATLGETFAIKFNNGLITGGNVISATARNLVSSKFLAAIRSYNNAAYNTGVYLVQGLADGITQNAYRVSNAANRISAYAISEMRRVLGVHSPSREAFTIGEFFVLGFANAIIAGVKTVNSATASLASEAIIVASDLASQIQDEMNKGIQIKPLITPVIDDTSVRQFNRQLSNRFAVGATNTIGARFEAGYKDGKSSGSNVSNTYYNFTQNNSSPKALDRDEIYRHTRTQFSGFVRKGNPACA